MRERIEVSFQAAIYTTRVPRRYLVTLSIEQIPTGIQAYVWGRKRAEEAMQHLVDNGEALLVQHGLVDRLAAEIWAKRREEEMAKVQVGDRVKLLVDIGPYKKGRVCRVVEVAEPTFYVSRGVNAWDDDKFPIAVVPVRAATDAMPLGERDHLQLMRGEFGPLTEEIDDE